MRVNCFCIYIVLTVTPLRAQLQDFSGLSFRKADSVARSHHGASLDNLPLLAHRLTCSLDTEVERFRAIYYWVCHNVQSAYGLKEKNDRRQYQLFGDSVALAQWNRDFHRTVVEKLRTQKKTLCSGYAFLIKQLAELVNISVVIINGYGTSPTVNRLALNAPNHAWNAVQLSGKWYLCDATWSSGYIDLTHKRFVFDFEPAYFLMAPKHFAKNHEPEEKQWLLLPNKEDL